MKNHMGKYSNTLAYRKCFLKLISSIGFQFYEPLRGVLHWSNLDFLILNPSPLNTLIYKTLQFSEYIFSFDFFLETCLPAWIRTTIGPGPEPGPGPGPEPGQDLDQDQD